MPDGTGEEKHATLQPSGEGILERTEPFRLATPKRGSPTVMPPTPCPSSALFLPALGLPLGPQAKGRRYKVGFATDAGVYGDSTSLPSAQVAMVSPSLWLFSPSLLLLQRDQSASTPLM